MALLDSLQKLINEHGSATILKERISLANDKHAALEVKIVDCEDKVQALTATVKKLESENQTLRFNLNQAEEKIKILEEGIYMVHNSNPDGYVCDHCGCSSLKRTGSRPDPTFGDAGIKQKLFICNKCGKESAFTPDE